MDYTVSIPEEREPCITAARAAKNEGVPESIDDPANPGTSIPNPAFLKDNAAYMQFVMDNATKSYCAQYFPNMPENPPVTTTTPT